MDYTEIRRHLHSIAEPSNEEKNTSSFIVEQLENTAPTKIRRFGSGHHILAEYDFGNGGSTVLLRADMDAVCVQESSSLPYHSLQKGVSHKCGHDGHSTILLAVAEILRKKPLPRGKVLLLFQGAEETGSGAQEILSDDMLSEYDIEHVYALHNIPATEKNTIICKPNSFTCSVVSCEITLKGKTAHAAEPWNAVSPFETANHITEFVMSLNNNNIDSDDFCVATLIEFRIGEKAYGVAAGNGVLRFTIRTKSDPLLKKIKSQIEEIVKTETAKIHGLESSVNWIEYFAATDNAAEAVDTIMQSAKKLGLEYYNKPAPFFWGEDFGLFTQNYTGALFGLGSGTCQPPLHHPDFDFPDEIIETGAKMFYELATRSV